MLLSHTSHPERLYPSLYNVSSGRADDDSRRGIGRGGWWTIGLCLLALALSSSAAEAANKKPIAKIVKVAPVNEGAAVTLDGSASSDKENGALTYAWVQTQGVPTVVLNGANTSTPNFTAPPIQKTNKATKPVKLAFQLTVTDPEGLSAVKKTAVKIKPLNAAPLANAGDDSNAGLSQNVTLTSLSHDPDAGRGGQIVKYQWKQLKKSGDPKVKLLNAKTAQASFVAPAAPAQLEFELAVTDNDGAKATDTVVVTVANVQPLTAAFSIDKKTLAPGGTATAKATAIAGGKGPYTVAFNWGDGGANEQQALAAGVVAKSAGHVYANVGQYNLTITVTDQNGGSKAQTFQITVSEPQAPALDGALSATQAVVAFNTPIQVKVDITGGAQPYRVKFEWGDGQSVGPTALGQGITAASDQHFYGQPGNYVITATITDANAGTKSVTTNVTVNPVEAPLEECQQANAH